jgi:hypothetical protein
MARLARKPAKDIWSTPYGIGRLQCERIYVARHEPDMASDASACGCGARWHMAMCGRTRLSSSATADSGRRERPKDELQRLDSPHCQDYPDNVSERLGW